MCGRARCHRASRARTCSPSSQDTTSLPLLPFSPFLPPSLSLTSSLGRGTAHVRGGGADRGGQLLGGGAGGTWGGLPPPLRQPLQVLLPLLPRFLPPTLHAPSASPLPPHALAALRGGCSALAGYARAGQRQHRPAVGALGRGEEGARASVRVEGERWAACSARLRPPRAPPPVPPPPRLRPHAPPSLLLHHASPARPLPGLSAAPHPNAPRVAAARPEPCIPDDSDRVSESSPPPPLLHHAHTLCLSAASHRHDPLSITSSTSPPSELDFAERMIRNAHGGHHLRAPSRTRWARSGCDL